MFGTGGVELAPLQADEPIFLLFTQEEREKGCVCDIGEQISN